MQKVKKEEEIKIRLAVVNDAAILAQIGWQAFDEAFGEHPKNHPDDMKLYRDEYFSVARLEMDLSDEKILYVVAELDGEIAGYAKIQFDSREDCVANGKTIELCRLYALDKFIGKGIGKTLMLKFLEIGQEKNCEIAWLGVWEFNYRAQEFYKKFGFEKCGEHIFQLGNDPQTDWVMHKRLNRDEYQDMWRTGYRVKINPLNAKGKYYVDQNSCLDHETCCGEAPNNFKMDRSTWGAYVFKQPENLEEEIQCKNAMCNCPMQAIHDKGE